MGAVLASLAAKPELIVSTLTMLAIFLLLISGKMPSIQGVIDCANVLNSKGGNLLLLALLSFYFFVTSVRFAYYLIELTVSKRLTPDNAIALSMFSFVTGTAFGGAFGALLKGMSGEAVTSTSASKVETVKSSETKITTPSAEEPTSSTSSTGGK